jgi:hypothetical protein
MKRTPDFTGRCGSATRINITALSTRAQGASLAAWLLHLPGQHPLWDYYELAVIHLRPIDGTPPPVLYEPDAEYEVIMLALNPEFQPDPDDPGTLHHLTPINYTLQFKGVTDAGAVEAVERVARRFVEGGLIAEPQGIWGARELFRQVFERALQEARRAEREA